MCIHIYVDVDISGYELCIYIYICKYITYVCIHVRTYAFVCMHVCTPAYIHTQMHVAILRLQSKVLGPLNIRCRIIIGPQKGP